MNPLFTLNLKNTSDSYREVELFNYSNLFDNYLWSNEDSVMTKNYVEISLVSNFKEITYKKLLYAYDAYSLGLIRLYIDNFSQDQLKHSFIYVDCSINKSLQENKKLEQEYKVLISPINTDYYDIHTNIVIGRTQYVKYNINPKENVKIEFYTQATINCSDALAGTKI